MGIEQFNVLSIGGGKEQLDGILIAKELGCYVITIDANLDCIGAKVSDEFHCIDIKETDKIVELARPKKIMGVIPNPIGRYLTTVGSINDALGLTGVNAKAAEIATDKSKFHQFAAKSNIPVTDQYEPIDPRVINYLPFNYPTILKPKHGSGSRGIKVVFSEKELREALTENKEYYTDGLLIERFIEGNVYGADIIVKNGIAEIICIRSKLITPLPYCVEYAYFTTNDTILKKRLSEILVKVVNGLELKNSLMHVDFIQNGKGEIYIIELSPRPSGLMISTRLVPLATGRNLIREFMLFMQGKTIPAFQSEKGTAALCYLVFPTAGNICPPKKENILSQEGVIEYQLPEPGYFQHEIKSMSDILGSGYLLLKTQDETSCKKLYEKLSNKFISNT